MKPVKETLKNFFRGTAIERPARRLIKKYRAYRGSEGDRIDNVAFDIIKRTIRGDSNCIDIGCSKGIYLDEMLWCAKDGVHYAFEPLPDHYQALRKKYRTRTNVKLFNVALSDSTGTISFHANLTNPGWSGIKKRDYPSDDDIVQTITVPTDRLDNVIPQNIQIDFIKIDVEGAEFLVLKGAGQLLTRCRPVILFEYGLGGSEFYSDAPDEVYDYLAECGYQLSKLDDYDRSHPPLDREHFSREYWKHLSYYFVAHPK